MFTQDRILVAKAAVHWVYKFFLCFLFSLMRFRLWVDGLSRLCKCIRLRIRSASDLPAFCSLCRPFLAPVCALLSRFSRVRLLQPCGLQPSTTSSSPGPGVPSSSALNHGARAWAALAPRGCVHLAWTEEERAGCPHTLSCRSEG